jgi:hypothetical protein
MAQSGGEVGLQHPIDQLRQSASAVAELIFHRRRQNTEGIGVTLGYKERVVPESTGPLFGEPKGAFDRARVRAKDLTFTGEGNAASEAASQQGFRFREVDGSEFLFEAFAIVSVCGAGTGKASGVNTGSASQDVDLQAGIVSEYPEVADRLAGGEGLNDGVGFEGRACFVGNWKVGVVSKILDLPP